MPHDDEHETTLRSAGSAGPGGDGARRDGASGRSAFLLEVSDAIRACADASAIPRESVRLLRAWLGADVVLWVEVGTATPIGASHPAEVGGGPLATRDLDEVLPDLAGALRAGRTTLVAGERATDQAGVQHTWSRAVLSVPVEEQGEVVAGLVAASATEREWDDREVAAVEDVAARTWRELARAREASDLREREERYRFLVESAQEYAIFMMDRDGRITSWNTGAERIIGYDDVEALGQPGAIIFTAEDRDNGAPQREMDMAVRIGRAADERWHVRKDGTRFWASGVLESLRTPDGSLRGFAKVLRDNTRRRRAEQALARERARLDTVLEVLPVGVVIADANGRIERGNAAARELWGVPFEGEAESWPEYAAFAAWWPETGERIAADEWAMSRAVRLGHQTHDELILSRRFGSDERRYYLNNVVPVRDADGEIDGGVAAMVDVTERLATERSLQEYRERLEDLVDERTREVRELAGHLSRAEQQERARIAQVLHDSVQQHLHAVQAKQGHAAHMLRKSTAVPEDVVVELAEAREWTREAIRVTRSLAVDLNPPVLRQQGLGRALSWLTSQMEQMHGLQVDLAANDEGDRLPWEVRLTAYQLVRELLFNIVKHANTERARVTVADEGSHVAIQVEDAGSGFVVPELGTGAPGAGLGLVSVRERIHYLGGDLQLESLPGRGTRVRLRIPFDRAHAGRGDPDGG